MYSIMKGMSGKYFARCKVQDGTESASFDNKEDAIDWLIGSAKALNNSTITVDNIEFSELRNIITQQLIEVPKDYRSL